MAVFRDRVPAHMLGTVFLYRGWFCGLVPVYVGRLDNPAAGPEVSVRNGIPEWTLDAVSAVWGWFLELTLSLNPEAQDPGWPIRITGRLDGKPLEAGLR